MKPTLELIPHVMSSISVQTSTVNEPTLPKFRHSNFSSARVVNSTFDKNLSVKIPDDFNTCQAEIEQIIVQIEQIYLQGPLVDGWLESYIYTPKSLATVLALETNAHLRDYVEAVASSEEELTCKVFYHGYHLCGLDANGKKWSCPCPRSQLSSVSLAIARYQKLQQLLQRKQYLETYLKHK